MYLERSELEIRAARHAALADPVRLHITDLLALGDLSPTELRLELGISSNLLAHHLAVLEREGMIARHRSEADRRRGYVHLLSGAFHHLSETRPVTAGRVLFVCTANSARSQLAAAAWRHASHVPAASAGTHPADRIAVGAVATARRHGLALPGGAPQRLEAVLADDDFIVTVCDRAREELGDRVCLHWSIPDPVRAATQAAFDAAFDDIAARIGDLVPHVSAPARPPTRSGA